jgi:DNA polymerase III sliding clamp (beta) subunit (PCNA family)
VSLVADRTSPVQLAFRADTVTIEAHSDGRARAAESVPVQFSGTDQVISFNPQYLLDGLAAAALCGPSRISAVPDAEPTGHIRLDFTSPAKPALISWADTADAEPDGAAQGDGNGVAGGQSGFDQLTSDGAGQAAARRSPFRYLVVPQRTPATG